MRRDRLWRNWQTPERKQSWPAPSAAALRLTARRS